MNRLVRYLISLIALLVAMPAQAVTLQYTISGVDVNAGGQIEYASFLIDSDRPVTDFLPGIGFFYAAVPGTYTYGGTTSTAPQDISFYLDREHGYADPFTQPGGLLVGEGDLLEFAGPQLFSGPIDHPTLSTGSFRVFDAFSGSPIALTVTALPEPASWALMILGFGAVGVVLRRWRGVPALA